MGNDPNPVEAFLQEKHGGLGDAFGRAANSSFGQRVIGKAGDAATAAAVGAGITVAGTYAGKLYDAATKGRDFRRMLEHDPRLQSRQDDDPRMFNQFYSTLRTFNPDFARDPVVAANYMHRMLDNPEAAGGQVVETLNFRDKIKSPLDTVMGSAMSAGKGESKSPTLPGPPPPQRPQQATQAPSAPSAYSSPQRSGQPMGQQQQQWVQQQAQPAQQKLPWSP